jgi:hypothetical protein
MTIKASVRGPDYGSPVNLTREDGKIGHKKDGTFHALAEGTELLADDQIQYHYIIQDGQVIFKNTGAPAEFIEGESVFIVPRDKS